MERQWKIREQSHVALVARVCGRHREGVTQQPVIVRLAKQIASQQLPTVRCALNPFYNAREHVALLVDLIGAARLCEVRLRASVWEKDQTKNQYGPKRNDGDADGPAKRPRCAFG